MITTLTASLLVATKIIAAFCGSYLAWRFIRPPRRDRQRSWRSIRELLRQDFPNGSDLSVYLPDYLEHIARTAEQPTPQTTQLEDASRSTQRATVRMTKSTRVASIGLNSTVKQAP